MLRHRATALLLFALLVAGSTIATLTAVRPDARAEDAAPAAARQTTTYQFLLVETTRLDRAGRNSRASLGVYRYADFQYRDPRFEELEAFFYDYLEPIGIHHLLMTGWVLEDVERPSDGPPTYLVRIEPDAFKTFIRKP